MEPPQSALANYYARRASEYEQIYKRAERQDDLCQLKDRISNAFARDTVLEIACGTGYWTQFIARRASAILAIDCNSEVLDIASQKDYGDCKVEFILADAYSLAEVPTKSGAGFGGFWWSHVPLPRLADFLTAFHSKLNKNAKVLFFDNGGIRLTPLRTRCSMWPWRTIRRQFWSSRSVSQPRRPAVSTWLNCVGRTAFVAHAAVIGERGSRNGDCIVAVTAISRSPLVQQAVAVEPVTGEDIRGGSPYAQEHNI